MSRGAGDAVEVELKPREPRKQGQRGGIGRELRLNVIATGTS